MHLSWIRAAFTGLLVVTGIVGAAEKSANPVWRIFYTGDAPAKEWTTGKNVKILSTGIRTEIKGPGAKSSFAFRSFDPSLFSGAIYRVSGEFRGEKITGGKQSYFGGCVQFAFTGKNGKMGWQGVPVPRGTFGWRKFDQVKYAPEDLEKVVFQIGIQNSTGVLELRNLKIEILGRTLDIFSAANMALKDDVSGDGKGGWTDQGPRQDGHNFSKVAWKNLYGSFPFRLSMSPAVKSVLAMYSPYFQKGPRRAEIQVKNPFSRARYFYLLHTLAWAPSGETKIGSVTLTGTNGKTQIFEIRSGREAGDWLDNIVHLPNGYCVIQEKTRGQSVGGLFVSRFRIDPDLGAVAKAVFDTAGSRAIWIISAATFSCADIPLPKTEIHRPAAGKDWVVFPMPEKLGIRENGSVLDLSPWMPKEKTGMFGRVIASPDGHFTFEKAPARRIRFFTCAVQEQFTSHEMVETLVREIRKAGYNMVRTHFLDSNLMRGAKKPLEFDKKQLDNFFYFVKCLKDNGLYLNFDCMTSWAGYNPGNIWSDPKVRDPRNSYKSRICFDPVARENWKKGVEKILLTRNPYTGTRLADDPVLACVQGFNEQGFAFSGRFDEKLASPSWHLFLKKRYAGSISSYNTAHGTKYVSFEDIPCFAGNFNLTDPDALRFRFETEKEIMRYFMTTLQKMGVKALFANFNAFKSQPYNLLRRDADMVTINAYHAHPTSCGKSMTRHPQESLGGKTNRLLRDILSVRLAGKPFVVTEHNIVFCNKYRYEQGFAVGGFSAFQNLDGLTCHAGPVSMLRHPQIRAFHLHMDPIIVSSEFLTWCLFARGDISPARDRVRVVIPADSIFRAEKPLQGITAAEFTSLALMTGFVIEVPDTFKRSLPEAKNEVRILADRTSKTVVGAGFAMSADTVSDSARLIAALKKRGVLPSGNRSDGHLLFETSTGEILLDAAKNFIRIDTPRCQGVCAEGGTRSSFRDFAIHSMTERGNLALAAMDGMKSISKADRMVLVYATNAINSGMEFSSEEMNVCLKQGKLPVLLRSGSFEIELIRPDASQFRMYPLDLSGRRGKAVLPVKDAEGKVLFRFDTGKSGAYVFFEFAKT